MNKNKARIEKKSFIRHLQHVILVLDFEKTQTQNMRDTPVVTFVENLFLDNRSKWSSFS